ncbi:MAG: glycine cleavage system aminomethyltransferase GcvT [Thermostichales cyanobacterium GMQP_bins_62]
MLRTPLYEWQRAAGAKFVPFAGWELPIQFQGVIAEHQAVRTQVGIFDISHMGRLILQGSRVREQLQALVPTDLGRLQPGESQYTVLLTEQGTILDDVICYCQTETQWLLIVNAARRQADWDWLAAHLKQTQMHDWGGSHVLLAIQGPASLPHLQALCGEDLSTLKRFQHRQVTLGDPDQTSAFVARTGYTGEDGFEVMVPPAAGLWLWQTCVERGIPPCGLGSRDTLRLEAALHLYGQDMDTTTTPLEAGLGWLVHWQKGEFMGRQALKQQKSQGIPRQLVGLQVLGRDIARPGYPIYSPGGEVIGRVTSGTKSPSLGIPIALGYVPVALASPGTRVEIGIRQQRVAAEVVKRPFYRSPAPAPR